MAESEADGLTRPLIILIDPKNECRIIVEADKASVFQDVNRSQGTTAPLKKQLVSASIPAAFEAYWFVMFQSARLLPHTFTEKLRFWS